MPNRLALESSPYLLQHQNNPVDWFAWGPAAFAEARRRDVPIFLSIGYSTCYWCHVMERESFESEAIAAQMNAAFVCVKVDREERPDVDDIYMAAVQAFTQRGGWPMSVFLEPNTLKPFWAGTYFPAEPKFQGIPAFPQVLGGIAQAWRERRAEIVEQAETLATAVQERIADVHLAPVRIGEQQVTQATSQLLRLHDQIRGGFGAAPKFPQPAFLDLLLTVRRAAGDDGTRSALESALNTTLTRMALGGMFDQVGGGFHRYSVDDQWLVPHFEKMLYDNGALAETYARATRELPGPNAPLFARTARRICEYVLREMTAPEGAFFAAQDAEVNHREGQNYLWTFDQLQSLLSAEDAAWISRVYGLSGGTNFRDPHHPSDAPANVLFLDEHALGATDWSPASPEIVRLDRINAMLYTARATRDQPGTDSKLIAGWNGLMIAGLAIAGAALNEPRFIAAAQRAADFIVSSMRGADGSLMRSFAAGRASIPAFLEDYAMLAHGLIALHKAGIANNPRYLHAAIKLMARAELLFKDGSGGYFDAPADQPDLFIRPRSTHDGAMPSGASVMINNLVDLASITGDTSHSARAAAALASLSAPIAAHPLGAANATRALLRLLSTDRSALDRALASAAAPPTIPHTSTDDAHVEILSAVDSVQVPANEPVGIVLRIRVSPGYHLTAADPGEGIVGLVPFAVHIIGGTGVAVFADYPAGVPYGPQQDIHVYSGEFDLPIVLEAAGEWSGTPIIAVSFQPCTDDACLAARTVELDVSVEPQ